MATKKKAVAGNKAYKGPTQNGKPKTKADFKDPDLFPKQQTKDVIKTGPKFLGMPLPSHLGPQFTRVYRGLHASNIHGSQSMETLDLNDIGGHWSHDRDVAMSMASGNDTRDFHGKTYLDSIATRKKGLHSLLVEGYAHKYDKETNQHTLKEAAVFGDNHPEKEFPVKAGGKIHITKVSKYKIHPAAQQVKGGTGDAVSQPEFVESQEFDNPITVTPKPLDRDGWTGRRLKEGRLANFDTGVNSKYRIENKGDK